MREDYEKLFTNLKPPEPPAGLFEKIMHRIQKEQRLLTLRKRIIIFSIGLAGSLAAFVPAFQMARQAFVESGFAQFFSLLFSDLGIITSYWQSFILTLLESLPVTSIAVLLITTLVFLESLKLLTKDIKTIFAPTQ